MIRAAIGGFGAAAGGEGIDDIALSLRRADAIAIFRARDATRRPRAAPPG